MATMLRAAGLAARAAARGAATGTMGRAAGAAACAMRGTAASAAAHAPKRAAAPVPPVLRPRAIARGFAAEAEGAAKAAPEAAAAETGGLMSAIAAFPVKFPFANNIIVATVKTAAADLMAQMVVEGKGVSEVDWTRNAVFVVFGAVYLGGFQWFVQVAIFRRIFGNIDKFANASIAEKLKDTAGQINLVKQVVVDALGHLVFIYLPCFYIVKESVQGKDGINPVAWVQNGVNKFWTNFWTDAPVLVKVWVPADILCFSIPMYLRMPVRHLISFAWTAYLSFLRGN